MSKLGAGKFDALRVWMKWEAWPTTYTLKVTFDCFPGAVDDAWMKSLQDDLRQQCVKKKARYVEGMQPFAMWVHNNRELYESGQVYELKHGDPAPQIPYGVEIRPRAQHVTIWPKRDWGDWKGIRIPYHPGVDNWPDVHKKGS